VYRRSGISRAIVPARNIPDLSEVPLAVRSALQVVPVRHFEEVLEAAFDPPILLLPMARL